MLERILKNLEPKGKSMLDDLVYRTRDFLISRCWFVFVVLIAVYSYFYFNYTLYDIDTGWFAEPAYTWIKGGPMAMPSWKGVMGFDQYTYWFPPIIFWLQIVTYKLLGFGMRQDLVLLLSIFIAAAYLTYYLARKLYGERVAKISVVLITSNVLYLTFALYSNRPDVLVGVWNVLAFLSYLKGKNDSRFFILAGAFCGLSISSHMVGSLMLPALALVYLMESKWKLSRDVVRVWILLGVGFFIGLVPQLVYASKDFDLFIEQRWYNTKGDPIKSLFMEKERLANFFLHKSMPFVSVLLLASLVYAWRRKQKDEYARMFLLIILLHVLVLPFVSHKSPRYYSSVLPFWTILVAKMLNDMFSSKKFARVSSWFFVLTFVFALGSYFASAMIMYHTNNYYSLEKYLDENYVSKEQGRVFLAQPAFFFIFRDKMYSYNLIFHRMGLYNESFENIMNDISPKYIIYDSHMEYYNSSNPQHPFWRFIEENTTLVDVVCFVGDERIEDERFYLRRMNHNYFELFKLIIFGDKRNCVDPVRIYVVGHLNS